MAENWAADVEKYVPDADEKAIAGIEKYCGIVMGGKLAIGRCPCSPINARHVREYGLGG